MLPKTPILLDTDLGSDIDDALCLAYLLRQPQCELLGITTVSGKVEERAAIGEVICRAFGHEHVPIHLGLSDTLADGPGQPNVPQYAAIKDRPHHGKYPTDGIDFLRRTIRSRPHEITLLSIGPLTNVAVLFALDPEIPSLLKGFVSMAGVFFRGDANEWNCLCDPSATTATLKRSHNHTLVGLDVTMKCQMKADEVRRRFAHSPLDVILAMAERWFQDSSVVTFHDPLAAALLFHPGLCHLATGHVAGDARNGHTAFTPGVDGPHQVATEVDAEAFFTEYFSLVA